MFRLGPTVTEASFSRLRLLCHPVVKTGNTGFPEEGIFHGCALSLYYLVVYVVNCKSTGKNRFSTFSFFPDRILHILQDWLLWLVVNVLAFSSSSTAIWYDHILDRQDLNRSKLVWWSDATSSVKYVQPFLDKLCKLEYLRKDLSPTNKKDSLQNMISLGLCLCWGCCFFRGLKHKKCTFELVRITQSSAIWIKEDQKAASKS